MIHSCCGSILYFVHFFIEAFLNSRMLATIGGTCSYVDSQIYHSLASPLWYVPFLPTMFPWMQPFFLKQQMLRRPSGGKSSTTLDETSGRFIYFRSPPHAKKKKERKKILKASQMCTQVWASINQSHLSCRVFQGEITIRPVWTCYLQAAELIYALLMCCHAGSVSCRQIRW